MRVIVGQLAAVEEALAEFRAEFKVFEKPELAGVPEGPSVVVGEEVEVCEDLRNVKQQAARLYLIKCVNRVHLNMHPVY